METPQIETPEWAHGLRQKMHVGWANQGDERFSAPTWEELYLKHTRVNVVYRDNGDIIFQFFPQCRLSQKDRCEDQPKCCSPHGPKWPGPEMGRAFLAECIEAHFGDTDRFQATYIPELESWGVIARGLVNVLAYNKAFHVDVFLALVDNTVDEL